MLTFQRCAMAKYKQLGLLVSAVALVGLAVAVFYHPAHKKKATQSTPEQAAQNDCAVKAYQNHIRDKLALWQPVLVGRKHPGRATPK
jgi:hypothetical protein